MARMRTHRQAREGASRRPGRMYRADHEAPNYTVPEELLPAGFVYCPGCSHPRRVKHDGVTIRSHRIPVKGVPKAQQQFCGGSNVKVVPKNALYMPERIIRSARAVECPSCGAEPGEPCRYPMARGSGISTSNHKARRDAHEMAGRPVLTIPAVNEQRHKTQVGHIAGRSPKVQVKGIVCPDCKAAIGESCTNPNTGNTMSSVHASRKRMATRKHNEERGL